MEITRSGILRDCLEEKNREMHRYSKHGAGLLPLEGYEQHFEDLQVTCNLLRDMILKAEAREDEVRPQRTAQWQKDLMAGNQPDMSWVYNTALQPREKKLPSEGKDYVWNPDTQTWDVPDDPLVAIPEPVVYPGGEA